MPFDADGNTKLDRSRISLLYRHARLARALRLKVEDFIQALRLLFAPDDQVVTTLAQVHQLYEFREWLKSSPFTISELRFILKGEESAMVKYQTNMETVGTIVQNVQDFQPTKLITMAMPGEIVRQVQTLGTTDLVEGLRVVLSKVLKLTPSDLENVLKAVKTDVNSAEVTAALNATFTNDQPDTPSDLSPLHDLLQDIAQVLEMATAETIVRMVRDSQPVESITSEILVEIVLEVQSSSNTNPVDRLNTVVAKLFKLTISELQDVLDVVNTDINSTRVLASLNATFTNDRPDNPSDLIPLRDPLQEIIEILKVEGLKDALSSFFNLTVNRLVDVLEGVNTDINSAGIMAALNATFTNDQLDNLSDLSPLDDLLQEISKALKVESLKTQISTFFNLTDKQFDDTLNWVSTDINSAGVETSLNASFTISDDKPPIPDDPDDLKALLSLMQETERALSVFSNLSFNEQTVAFLTENSVDYLTGTLTGLGIGDLKNLTLASLKALTVYNKLIALGDDAEQTVQSALLSYQDSNYKNWVALNVEAESAGQPVLLSYQAANLFTAEDAGRLADLWRQNVSLVESLINAPALPAIPSIPRLPAQPRSPIDLSALNPASGGSSSRTLPSNPMDLTLLNPASVGINSPTTFTPLITPIEALESLWERLKLCQTLGIDGYSLQRLADDTSFEAIETARDIALGAFMSKYDDEKTRQEKLEPYQDQINDLKRDALCDYIIAREKNLKFKDTNDLYAFFLLDVEMEGCFRTSRVVAGISSLQLYIHRILVHLEQSETTDVKVDPSSIPQEQWNDLVRQWEWRKNYRVWEANRKVFLYPENYTEPDLRGNKTPIFKELEEELLQEKITKESAEAAYKKYVAELTVLAKLRIVGSYYKLNDTHDGIYYFFGRTHTDPYQYYYRTYQQPENYWGNWTKIELAIEAEEISALVYLEKLYVFWTHVERREITKVTIGTATPGGYVFTLYVKYSYLDEHGKWSAPQRVEVGYLVLDKPELQRLGLDDLTETNKPLAVERFQEKVFRKPYPILTGDSSAPIKLYYIWSHEKEKQPSPGVEDIIDCYRTKLLDKQIKLTATTTEPVDDPTAIPREPPAADRPGEAKSIRDKMRLVLKPIEFKVINNHFPVTKRVSYELGGDKVYGSLVLHSAIKCTLTVPQITNNGTHKESVLVERCGRTSNPSSSSSVPVPKMSCHEIALATNKIDDAGKLELKKLASSNGSFLRNEYSVANDKNAHAGYVQDGTKDFTATGRVVYQFPQYENQLQITEQNQLKEISLSTVLIDELSQRIFAEKIDAFLALDTQMMEDSNGLRLDFDGPYGTYYRELFFHIPFLIANHLNANQKFKEAKWWYERIFDPTASESPHDAVPTDRNWRFIEFRNMNIKKMKKILTDNDAIEVYKQDPFNPHAIARLRPGAYQKTIVMKYIDNLLDWGDNLFAQDTMESINEATMLYVLASDILGKRPVKLGKCETARDQDLTYKQIGPEIKKGSEFLINLESWHINIGYEAESSQSKVAQIMRAGPDSANISLKEAVVGMTTSPVVSNARGTKIDNDMQNATSFVATSDEMIMKVGNTSSAIAPRYSIAHYNNIVNKKTQDKKGGYSLAGADLALNNLAKYKPTWDSRVVKQTAFCTPVNADLLKYWDRVEDRLFKIRHCMSISGERRQLALFQPPIDPMLLVRAKAAGLSLEDIVSMLTGTLPPYRFSYLIEKAKQFTQTVQQFGGTLLSALEKKDVEELTLLRSVHERNILHMTTEIKKQQIIEAQHQYQAMVETKTNVENRINYYRGLLDAELTGWEVTQQVTKHSATVLKIAESIVHLQAGITFLIPQIGSPFAMKYGGQELGNSGVEFAQWTSSLASILDAVSASAGLEASFQRREQEWNQQLCLAEQELEQVEQQRLAAEVRQFITEKDLEIHEKNIEQADELHEFYKNKFTKLGLYNYLSTTLNRLYREAYNVAYDLAKMAERTYQFERDDDTVFIAGDNWQFDRAGLLAGERLILQLQRLEKAYLEQNARDYEVTQSFSLALLDPEALLALKKTDACDFTIPEFAFDLSYPGQYRRIIKSVRLSIPCVVGPYTNISAKLSLVGSKVRKEASIDPAALIGIPNSKLTTTSIAASNAQNDSGLFELNFRDERYLPFEGAGAISEWRLELPSTMRLFDYDTISDVILHISYTAKDDGVLKDSVEAEIANKLSEFAAVHGLYRLLSLRHEFPNAFHRLVTTASGSELTTEFELTKQHFPYFLNDQTLSIAETTVYLQPKGKDPVDIATGISLSVTSISDSGEWIVTLDAGEDGLDTEALSDILILLKYTI